MYVVHVSYMYTCNNIAHEYVNSVYCTYMHAYVNIDSLELQ